MPFSSVPRDVVRAFVVRQPVFDRARRIFAYELLHRPSGAGASHGSAARVLSDAVSTIGLDTLAGPKPAMVHVTREMLLGGLPGSLPADRIVVQLPGDLTADAAVIEACDALRRAAYVLAIDGFVPEGPAASLASFAQFVKMPAVAIASGARGPKQGPAVIATGVDDLGLLESAAAGGATYFQGRCLGQPAVTSARRVPGAQLTYVRLLRALNQPNLALHDLEDLIKHDTALCHRILQTVNSAGFGLRRTVDSIRDALLLLGRDTIRRWASLWVLAGLGGGQSELVAMATVRGRCCELLGASLQGDDGAVEGFLLGLCSLLDAILGRPMAELLKDLPLDALTTAALLGQDNIKGRLLRCAIAYERGQWDDAFGLARELGLDPVRLPGAYVEALRWSHDLELSKAA